jgi:hypothetical protein
VRYDFSSNIPDASPVSGSIASLGNISASTTLPRAGDTPNAAGRYVYDASQIALSNTTLTIDGPVDLVVSGNISVGGGSGSINVRSGAGRSFNLYAAGDISISGNGAVNESSTPPNMAIYGTRTQTQATALGAQQFDFRGNASYSGLLYAPNADVSLRGGGSSGRFDGAIIGKTVTFNGNYSFHYDVQLANVQSDRYFKPSSWIELIAPPGSGAALARDNRQPFNSVF